MSFDLRSVHEKYVCLSVHPLWLLQQSGSNICQMCSCGRRHVRGISCITVSLQLCYKHPHSHRVICLLRVLWAGSY